MNFSAFTVGFFFLVDYSYSFSRVLPGSSFHVRRNGLEPSKPSIASICYQFIRYDPRGNLSSTCCSLSSSHNFRLAVCVDHPLVSRYILGSSYHPKSVSSVRFLWRFVRQYAMPLLYLPVTVFLNLINAVTSKSDIYFSRDP